MKKLINNTIKIEYCSFETAKALNEKSFDVWSEGMYYDTNGEFYPGFSSNISDYDDKIHRPPISLAVDWILVNYGLHINVMPIKYNEEFKWIFDVSIASLDTVSLKPSLAEKHWFETKNEAWDAGIYHVLTNLIK